MTPHREKALWEITQAFRDINRILGVFSAELKKEHNITGPQAGILKIVAEYGPLNLTEVCGRAFRHITTVGGIVDRLERDGFVRRRRTSPDRRKVMLEATPKGKKLASSAPFIAPARAMNAMGRLPMKEILKIRDSMQTLLGILGEDIRDLKQGEGKGQRTHR